MSTDGSNQDSRQHQSSVRSQDLEFTKAELDKAFGKRMTRKEYLQSLRKQYDRKENNNG